MTGLPHPLRLPRYYFPVRNLTKLLRVRIKLVAQIRIIGRGPRFGCPCSSLWGSKRHFTRPILRVLLPESRQDKPSGKSTEVVHCGAPL